MEMGMITLKPHNSITHASTLVAIDPCAARIWSCCYSFTLDPLDSTRFRNPTNNRAKSSAIFGPKGLEDRS